MSHQISLYQMFERQYFPSYILTKSLAFNQEHSLGIVTCDTLAFWSGERLITPMATIHQKASQSRGQLLPMVNPQTQLKHYYHVRTLVSRAGINDYILKFAVGCNY